MSYDYADSELDASIINELKKRIEALEAALREAEWLVREFARHEGAEGWSEYLRKRLVAYTFLAPEEEK